MDLEKIKREYDLVKSTLYVTAPFISSLLARARVIVNKSIDTAAVSPEGVIVINPDFWEGLNWNEKAWILGHETFHLAFRDHKRQGNKDARAFYICCEAVNNELLKELIKMPPRIEASCLTMDKLYEVLQPQMKYEDFLKLSKEEIYKLLPKMPRGEPTCPKCGSRNIVVKKLDLTRRIAHLKCKDCGYEWIARVELGGAGEGVPIPVEEIVNDINRGDGSSGEILQEGDPSIYKDGKESDGEEVDERWRENIARAYDLQKTIGKVPAGLKRLVDQLLKPRINWRSLLKQAFRVGFGKIVVESWKRQSRKSDDYPGIRRYTLPTVWCLVDMSGSISDKEAAQFLTEVYEIAGLCPVKVICWDAKAYDIVEAKSKNEVITKVLKKLRGCGGTIIKDTLEKTLNGMKVKDAVIVLTDGEIYDIDSDKTAQLLSNIASKASVAVLVSTHRELNVPGWRFIKLDIA